MVSGRYEGETGLVVRIEHNLAILFSDLTMHEVGAGLGLGVAADIMYAVSVQGLQEQMTTSIALAYKCS